jgi:AcrR family transcriptional regulator
VIDVTPRKSAKQELTKEAIIDVARELFVSEGYATVSMRVIAKYLNCSHGAIYYHFKNKAELFYEIVEADFNKLNQELEDVISETHTSGEEKIFAILYRFIKFGLTHQKHYEVMFMIRDEDLECYMQDGPSKSYAHFAEAIASLNTRQLTAQEIWSLFISMHGFVSHYCRAEIIFEDIKDLAIAHVQFLIKAIK